MMAWMGRFILGTVFFGLTVGRTAAASETEATLKASTGQKSAVGSPENAEKKAGENASEQKEAPIADAKAGRSTATVWRATVKVVNPDDARVTLLQEVRKLGGFPMFFNGGSLSLKVPPAALSMLTEKVEAMGIVLEKTLSREDVTLQIAEIEGKLKSKGDILVRTRKFLEDSDVPSTLEIERSMTGLVMEIEGLQGSLRVLRDRIAFAVAEISFAFRERDKIVYVQSPFEWLNTVDVARFTEEF